MFAKIGETIAPCGVPPKVIPPFAPFHDAGIEPLDNQADNPPVADTVYRLAGNPGDLFDLICHAAGYGDKARGMAAGSDFLEAEREARRQLAAELAPHAEALCRRFLPESATAHDLPDVLTVHEGGQASPISIHLLLDLIHIEGKHHDDDLSATMAPERGTWKNEATGRQGDLRSAGLSSKPSRKHGVSSPPRSRFYAGAFCRRFLLESVRTVSTCRARSLSGTKTKRNP